MPPVTSVFLPMSKHGEYWEPSESWIRISNRFSTLFKQLGPCLGNHDKDTTLSD